jgi:hypothetical protein
MSFHIRDFEHPGILVSMWVLESILYGYQEMTAGKGKFKTREVSGTSTVQPALPGTRATELHFLMLWTHPGEQTGGGGRGHIPPYF